MKFRTIILLLLAAVASAAPLQAKTRLNDKLLNRPYADMRRWHLGFGVGVNTFGFTFTHNGFVTEGRQTWYMEQPTYSPGFCVNGLFSVRLNEYFSVRATPGLWFGNRNITFRDLSGTAEVTEYTQDIKSAYIVCPIEVKYAAKRFRNMRPYLVGGFVPGYDVLKKQGDFLRMKGPDMMLSVGFGCDFYLPFFKLNPEIKFCFGLSDALTHKRPDLVDDPVRTDVSSSVKKATTKMVVLTFFFE